VSALQRARRILAELPDGWYPLNDLIALDMRFCTAAMALFILMK